MYYAIVDTNTNIVNNVVVCDCDDHAFASNTEYAVRANKFVKIGMIYDLGTQTFPEVGDKVEKFELIEKVNNLVGEHQNKVTAYMHLMTDAEIEAHYDYINQLGTVFDQETYAEMQTVWDSKPDAPSFPTKPVEIDANTFRNQLTLTEKVLWDNPSTGTSAQAAVINTMKADFPFIGDAIQEYLNALETNEVIGVGRADAIYTALTLL